MARNESRIVQFKLIEASAEARKSAFSNPLLNKKESFQKCRAGCYAIFFLCCIFFSNIFYHCCDTQNLIRHVLIEKLDSRSKERWGQCTKMDGAETYLIFIVFHPQDFLKVSHPRFYIMGEALLPPNTEVTVLIYSRPHLFNVQISNFAVSCFSI